MLIRLNLNYRKINKIDEIYENTTGHTGFKKEFIYCIACRRYIYIYLHRDPYVMYNIYIYICIYD